MANRFWVGGTGYWSDAAHWSATGEGVGGASVPTKNDNVYIGPAHSENQMIIVDRNIEFNDLSSTYGTGTFPHYLHFNGHTIVSYGYNGLRFYDAGNAISHINISNCLIKTVVWQIKAVSYPYPQIITTNSTILMTQEIRNDTDAWFSDERPVSTYHNITFNLCSSFSWASGSFWNFAGQLTCNNLSILVPGTYTQNFWGKYSLSDIGAITVLESFTTNTTVSKGNKLRLYYLNIIKPSGRVDIENCRLTDCGAYGGATFYSPLSKGNTDGGNNIGWIWTDPPPPGYPEGGYNEGNTFALAPGDDKEGYVGTAVWPNVEFDMRNDPITPTHSPGCGYFWKVPGRSDGPTNEPAKYVNKNNLWLGNKGNGPWEL